MNSHRVEWTPNESLRDAWFQLGGAPNPPGPTKEQVCSAQALSTLSAHKQVRSTPVSSSLLAAMHSTLLLVETSIMPINASRQQSIVRAFLHNRTG